MCMTGLETDIWGLLNFQCQFKKKIARYEMIEFVPSKSLEEFEELMKKIK